MVDDKLECYSVVSVADFRKVFRVNILCSQHAKVKVMLKVNNKSNYRKKVS